MGEYLVEILVLIIFFLYYVIKKIYSIRISKLGGN